MKRVVQSINSKIRRPCGRCSSRHQNQLIWGHASTRPVPFSVQRPFILGACAIMAPFFSFGANRLERSHKGHQCVMSLSGISTHLGAPQTLLPNSLLHRSTFPFLIRSKEVDGSPCLGIPQKPSDKALPAGRGQKTSKMGLNTPRAKLQGWDNPLKQILVPLAVSAAAGGISRLPQEHILARSF